jgi:Recombinase
MQTTTNSDQRARPALAQQRKALLRAARDRGWRELRKRDQLEWFAEEPLASGLEVAFETLDRGPQTGLAIRTSGRPSGDYISDLGKIVNEAQQKGWVLVGLFHADDAEVGLREVVVTLVPAARYLHAQRTREAVGRKRAEGTRLGRPRGLPDEIVLRVLEEHWSGGSLRSIAEKLNRGGVPTAHGGARWHASTVNAVLGSLAARELSKAAAEFELPEPAGKRAQTGAQEVAS